MNQEIWTPEEQAAFADFMKKQFPNELHSFATMSLGSAWKDGQANAPVPPAGDELEVLACASFAKSGNIQCWSLQRDHASLRKLEGEGHTVIDLVDRQHVTALTARLATSEKWAREHCNRAEGFAGQIIELTDQVESLTGAAIATPPQPDHSAQPVAYVLHKNGEVDWDQETVISNTGGDEQDERWKWVPVYAQPLNTVQGDAHATCMAHSPEPCQCIPCVPHADAGEIERLRSELNGIKESLAYRGSLLWRTEKERDELRVKLADAAQSLETISTQAGRDEFMQDMIQVRAYANSRAKVAREGLSASAEPTKMLVECDACPTSGGCVGTCMKAPSTQKLCQECDKPYCLGVCVERGDEHYDRDHAGKGGDHE